jgi:very-short-patch-repair endonuclease
LRLNSTKAELLIGCHLRNRQLDDFKFVRRAPIGHYYADFLRRDGRLIVEIDGDQYADSEADRRRDALKGVMHILLTELRKEPLTELSSRKREGV